LQKNFASFDLIFPRTSKLLSVFRYDSPMIHDSHLSTPTWLLQESCYRREFEWDLRNFCLCESKITIFLQEYHTLRTTMQFCSDAKYISDE
jgi:hypothetical protein